MEFTAPSGAPVVINLAPWKDAKALKMAIQKEMALTGQEIGLDMIGAAFLRVDSSPAVDAALWPCLARCLRAGEKVTEMTFDAAAARQDYYEIVTACVKENLGPLVGSLFSKLEELKILKKPGDAAPESP